MHKLTLDLLNNQDTVLYLDWKDKSTATIGGKFKKDHIQLIFSTKHTYLNKNNIRKVANDLIKDYTLPSASIGITLQVLSTKIIDNHTLLVLTNQGAFKTKLQAVENEVCLYNVNISYININFNTLTLHSEGKLTPDKCISVPHSSSKLLVRNSSHNTIYTLPHILFQNAELFTNTEDLLEYLI